MKDIDFDELDRAVNSLINNPTSGNKVTAVPTLSTSTSPTSITSSITDPSSTARRSSGRFMDVVHPSSDMRTSPSSSTNTVPSREGVTITPSKAASEATVQTSHVSSPKLNNETITPSAKSWPDPIDLSEVASQAPKSTAQPSVKSTPSENQVAGMAKPLEQDMSQLPDSPFLDNAKVEKRPLGAFSAEPSVSTEVPSTTTEPTSPGGTEATDSAEYPVETDMPLPAELQDNLLSIEDDEGSVAATPTSITQQYTEQPSTGDQPAGAIFDADAYHKPLAHPAKKKSGWLIVLWIFLLLVVGAGTGAAVYFYVLPLI
jgi:hypothetical protein